MGVFAPVTVIPVIPVTVIPVIPVIPVILTCHRNSVTVIPVAEPGLHDAASMGEWAVRDWVRLADAGRIA